MVTVEDLIKVIREERLSDKNICIHSSIKSFGGLENGPYGIIESFLKENCTILVPTFSEKYEANPVENMMPKQNGYDDSLIKENPCEEIYNPDSTEIDVIDMGILPATIVAMKERIRGDHPLNSFSAIGRNTGKLIEGQKALDVYFPLEKLTEENGIVVLMGVGFDSMTLLHLAEKKAGRNLFRRWAKDRSGNTMMVEAGGCSEGFTNFAKYFYDSGIVKERTVGKSPWKIMNAKEALLLAANLIKMNPEITMCESRCARCVDAAKGGPIL